MIKKSKGQKIIAGVTAFLFLFTNLGSAQIPAQVSSSPAVAEASDIINGKISVPEEFGSIQTEFRGAGKSPFIIFIQDAHAVVDAQENIRNLVRYFSKNHGVNLVALEGGDGKLDPTLLRTFPDPELKEKILADYRDRGELTGPQMASVLDPAEASYFGIEEWPLYEAHYAAYLGAVGNQPLLLEDLAAREKEFDLERAKLYSPAHNEFHEKAMAFRQERLSLLEYLKYLKTLRQEGPGETPYPNLAKLMDSIAKGESFDQESIEVEVRYFADEFKRLHLGKLSKEKMMEFNGRYQDLSTGRMDAASFLKYLVETAGPAGVNLKITDSMKELLGHRENLAAIKGTRVFDELEAFIAGLEAGYAATSGEKELSSKYERLLLLTGLVKLELSRDKVEKYRSSPKEYLAILTDPKPIAPSLEFYKYALLRDEVLQKNLEALMKREKRNSAIVVLGGFHRQGFEKRLKGEGFSYCTIAPRIDSLTGTENYASVMQGNLSYKDEIATTFYDAFMRASSLKLVAGLAEPEFRKFLKTWRDTILRQLGDSGRLAEAPRYTRYIDLLLKVYIEKFGTGNFSKKSKEEILKDVEGELNSFKENAFRGAWDRFERRLGVFKSGLKTLVEKKELTPRNVRTLMDEAGQAKLSVLGCSLGAMIPGQRDRLLADVAKLGMKAILPKVTVEDLAGVLGDMAGSAAVPAELAEKMAAPAKEMVSTLRAAQRTMPDVKIAGGKEAKAAVEGVVGGLAERLNEGGLPGQKVTRAEVAAALRETIAKESPAILRPDAKPYRAAQRGAPEILGAKGAPVRAAPQAKPALVDVKGDVLTGSAKTGKDGASLGKKVNASVVPSENEDVEGDAAANRETLGGTGATTGITEQAIKSVMSGQGIPALPAGDEGEGKSVLNIAAAEPGFKSILRFQETGNSRHLAPVLELKDGVLPVESLTLSIALTDGVTGEDVIAFENGFAEAGYDLQRLMEGHDASHAGILGPLLDSLERAGIPVEAVRYGAEQKDKIERYFNKSGEIRTRQNKMENPGGKSRLKPEEKDALWALIELDSIASAMKWNLDDKMDFDNVWLRMLYEWAFRTLTDSFGAVTSSHLKDEILNEALWILNKFSDEGRRDWLGPALGFVYETKGFADHPNVAPLLREEGLSPRRIYLDWLSEEYSADRRFGFDKRVIDGLKDLLDVREAIEAVELRPADSAEAHQEAMEARWTEANYRKYEKALSVIANYGVDFKNSVRDERTKRAMDDILSWFILTASNDEQYPWLIAALNCALDIEAFEKGRCAKIQAVSRQGALGITPDALKTANLRKPSLPFKAGEDHLSDSFTDVESMRRLGLWDLTGRNWWWDFDAVLRNLKATDLNSRSEEIPRQRSTIKARVLGLIDSEKFVPFVMGKIGQAFAKENERRAKDKKPLVEFSDEMVLNLTLMGTYSHGTGKGDVDIVAFVVTDDEELLRNYGIRPEDKKRRWVAKTDEKDAPEEIFEDGSIKEVDAMIIPVSKTAFEAMGGEETFSVDLPPHLANLWASGFPIYGRWDLVREPSRETLMSTFLTLMESGVFNWSKLAQEGNTKKQEKFAKRIIEGFITLLMAQGPTADLLDRVLADKRNSASAVFVYGILNYLMLGEEEYPDFIESVIRELKSGDESKRQKGGEYLLLLGFFRAMMTAKDTIDSLDLGGDEKLAYYYHFLKTGREFSSCIPVGFAIQDGFPDFEEAKKELNALRGRKIADLLRANGVPVPKAHPAAAETDEGASLGSETEAGVSKVPPVMKVLFPEIRRIFSLWLFVFPLSLLVNAVAQNVFNYTGLEGMSVFFKTALLYFGLQWMIAIWNYGFMAGMAPKEGYRVPLAQLRDTEKGKRIVYLDGSGKSPRLLALPSSIAGIPFYGLNLLLRILIPSRSLREKRKAANLVQAVTAVSMIHYFGWLPGLALMGLGTFAFGQAAVGVVNLYERFNRKTAAVREARQRAGTAREEARQELEKVMAAIRPPGGEVEPEAGAPAGDGLRVKVTRRVPVTPRVPDGYYIPQLKRWDRIFISPEAESEYPEFAEFTGDAVFLGSARGRTYLLEQGKFGIHVSGDLLEEALAREWIQRVATLEVPLSELQPEDLFTPDGGADVLSLILATGGIDGVKYVSTPRQKNDTVFESRDLTGDRVRQSVEMIFAGLAENFKTRLFRLSVEREAGRAFIRIVPSSLSFTEAATDKVILPTDAVESASLGTRNGGLIGGPAPGIGVRDVLHGIDDYDGRVGSVFRDSIASLLSAMRLAHERDGLHGIEIADLDEVERRLEEDGTDLAAVLAPIAHKTIWADEVIPETLRLLNQRTALIQAARNRIHDPARVGLIYFGEDGYLPPYSVYQRGMNFEIGNLMGAWPAGTNTIVLGNLRLDPGLFVDIAGISEAIRQKYFPFVQNGDEFGMAFKETVKNGVIHGNANRSGNVIVLRWRIAGDLLILDVIDEGLRPIDIEAGKIQAGEAVSPAILYSGARKGLAVYISQFLFKEAVAGASYDLPLTDDDGRRVGQIVRLLSHYESEAAAERQTRLLGLSAADREEVKSATVSIVRAGFYDAARGKSLGTGVPEDPNGLYREFDAKVRASLRKCMINGKDEVLDALAETLGGVEGQISLIFEGPFSNEQLFAYNTYISRIKKIIKAFQILLKFKREELTPQVLQDSVWAAISFLADPDVLRGTPEVTAGEDKIDITVSGPESQAVRLTFTHVPASGTCLGEIFYCGDIVGGGGWDKALPPVTFRSLKEWENGIGKGFENLKKLPELAWLKSDAGAEEGVAVEIPPNRKAMLALVESIVPGDPEGFAFLRRSEKARGSVKPRVGIFATSANPLHLDHERLIRDIMKDKGLDEVVIMLSPHHVTKKPLAAEEIVGRAEMMEAAFEGDPDISIAVCGRSFYQDFGRAGQKNIPGAEIFLIMGMDNLEVTLNRRPQEFVDLKNEGVRVIINSRQEDATRETMDALAGKYGLPSGLMDYYSFRSRQLSSSLVRTLVADGEEEVWARMVRPEVAQAIREKGLFGVKADSGQRRKVYEANKDLVNALIRGDSVFGKLEHPEVWTVLGGSSLGDAVEDFLDYLENERGGTNQGLRDLGIEPGAMRSLYETIGAIAALGDVPAEPGYVYEILRMLNTEANLTELPSMSARLDRLRGIAVRKKKEKDSGALDPTFFEGYGLVVAFRTWVIRFKIDAVPESRLIAGTQVGSEKARSNAERPAGYPPRVDLGSTWEESAGRWAPYYVAPVVLKNYPDGWAQPEDIRLVIDEIIENCRLSGHDPVKFGVFLVRRDASGNIVEAAFKRESGAEELEEFKNSTGVFREEDGDEVWMMPMNPQGPTGLYGRGLLGNWGPTYAADPIITRVNPETGELEFLAIQRGDRKDRGKDDEWAIPGGMVNPGEAISGTLKRELLEETTDDEEPQGLDLEEMFENAEVLYQGLVDDPRNTVSYMVTVAKHLHLTREEAGKLPLKAGDDADHVQWQPIRGNLDNLYASHGVLLRIVLEQWEEAEAKKRALEARVEEQDDAFREDLLRQHVDLKGENVFMGAVREVRVDPAPRIEHLPLFIDVSSDMKVIRYYDMPKGMTEGEFARQIDAGTVKPFLILHTEGEVSADEVTAAEKKVMEDQLLITPSQNAKEYLLGNAGSAAERDRIAAMMDWDRNYGKRHVRYRAEGAKTAIITSWDKDIDKDVWAAMIDTVYLHNELVQNGILDNPTYQSVLELGTGGGHIITAMAQALEGVTDVSYTDISPYALRAAKRAIEDNLPEEKRGKIRHHAILGAGVIALIGNKYDLILVNPPYIPIPDYLQKDEAEKEKFLREIEGKIESLQEELRKLPPAEAKAREPELAKLREELSVAREGNGYAGTSLIREVLQFVDQLLTDNPDAMLILHISSVTEADLPQYIAEFGDRFIIEPFGDPAKVPLKIETMEDPWKEWFMERGLVTKNIDAHGRSMETYSHVIQAYRIRLKTSQVKAEEAGEARAVVRERLRNLNPVRPPTEEEDAALSAALKEAFGDDEEARNNFLNKFSNSGPVNYQIWQQSLDARQVFPPELTLAEQIKLIALAIRLIEDQGAKITGKAVSINFRPLIERLKTPRDLETLHRLLAEKSVDQIVELDREYREADLSGKDMRRFVEYRFLQMDFDEKSQTLVFGDNEYDVFYDTVLRPLMAVANGKEESRLQWDLETFLYFFDRVKEFADRIAAEVTPEMLEYYAPIVHNRGYFYGKKPTSKVDANGKPVYQSLAEQIWDDADPFIGGVLLEEEGGFLTKEQLEGYLTPAARETYIKMQTTPGAFKLYLRDLRPEKQEAFYQAYLTWVYRETKREPFGEDGRLKREIIEKAKDLVGAAREDTAIFNSLARPWEELLKDAEDKEILSEDAKVVDKSTRLAEDRPITTAARQQRLFLLALQKDAVVGALILARISPNRFPQEKISRIAFLNEAFHGIYKTYGQYGGREAFEARNEDGSLTYPLVVGTYTELKQTQPAVLALDEPMLKAILEAEQRRFEILPEAGAETGGTSTEGATALELTPKEIERSVDEIIRSLRLESYFRGLPVDGPAYSAVRDFVKKLIANGGLVSYRSGVNIYKERPDHFNFILEGKVQLKTNPYSHELEILPGGEFDGPEFGRNSGVGAWSAAGQGGHWGEMRAMGPVVALTMNGAQYEELIRITLGIGIDGVTFGLQEIPEEDVARMESEGLILRYSGGAGGIYFIQNARTIGKKMKKYETESGSIEAELAGGVTDERRIELERRKEELDGALARMRMKDIYALNDFDFVVKTVDGKWRGVSHFIQFGIKNSSGNQYLLQEQFFRTAEELRNMPEELRDKKTVQEPNNGEFLAMARNVREVSRGDLNELPFAGHIYFVTVGEVPMKERTTSPEGEIVIRLTVNGEVREVGGIPIPVDGVVDPVYLLKDARIRALIGQEAEVVGVSIKLAVEENARVYSLRVEDYLADVRNSYQYNLDELANQIRLQNYYFSDTPEAEVPEAKAFKELFEAAEEALETGIKKGYTDLSQNHRIELGELVFQWMKSERLDKWATDMVLFDRDLVGMIFALFVAGQIGEDFVANHEVLGRYWDQMQASDTEAEKKARRVFSEYQSWKSKKESALADLTPEERANYGWQEIKFAFGMGVDSVISKRETSGLVAVPTDAMTFHGERLRLPSRAGLESRDLIVIADRHENYDGLVQELIGMHVIREVRAEDGKMRFELDTEAMEGKRIVQLGDNINRNVGPKGKALLDLWTMLYRAAREFNRGVSPERQIEIDLVLGNHELDLLRWDETEMRANFPGLGQRLLADEVKEQLRSMVGEGILKASFYVGDESAPQDPESHLLVFHAGLLPQVRESLLKLMKAENLSRPGEEPWPLNDLGIVRYVNEQLKIAVRENAFRGDGAEFTGRNIIFGKSRRRGGTQDMSGLMEADFGRLKSSDIAQAMLALAKDILTAEEGWSEAQWDELFETDARGNTVMRKGKESECEAALSGLRERMEREFGYMIAGHSFRAVGEIGPAYSGALTLAGNSVFDAGNHQNFGPSPQNEETAVAFVVRGGSPYLVYTTTTEKGPRPKSEKELDLWIEVYKAMKKVAGLPEGAGLDEIRKALIEIRKLLAEITPEQAEADTELADAVGTVEKNAEAVDILQVLAARLLPEWANFWESDPAAFERKVDLYEQLDLSLNGQAKLNASPRSIGLLVENSGEETAARGGVIETKDDAVFAVSGLFEMLSPDGKVGRKVDIREPGTMGAGFLVSCSKIPMRVSVSDGAVYLRIPGEKMEELLRDNPGFRQFIDWQMSMLAKPAAGASETDGKSLGNSAEVSGIAERYRRLVREEDADIVNLLREIAVGLQPRDERVRSEIEANREKLLGTGLVIGVGPQLHQLQTETGSDPNTIVMTPETAGAIVGEESKSANPAFGAALAKLDLGNAPPIYRNFLALPHYNANWHTERGEKAVLRDHLEAMWESLERAEDDDFYDGVPMEARYWVREWKKNDSDMLKAFIFLHDLGKVARHQKKDKPGEGYASRGHEVASYDLLEPVSGVRYSGLDEASMRLLRAVIKNHISVFTVKTPGDIENLRGSFEEEGIPPQEFERAISLSLATLTLDYMGSYASDHGSLGSMERKMEPIANFIRAFHEWKAMEASEEARSPEKVLDAQKLNIEAKMESARQGRGRAGDPNSGFAAVIALGHIGGDVSELILPVIELLMQIVANDKKLKLPADDFFQGNACKSIAELLSREKIREILGADGIEKVKRALEVTANENVYDVVRRAAIDAVKKIEKAERSDFLQWREQLMSDRPLSVDLEAYWWIRSIPREALVDASGNINEETLKGILSVLGRSVEYEAANGVHHDGNMIRDYLLGSLNLLYRIVMDLPLPQGKDTNGFDVLPGGLVFQENADPLNEKNSIGSIRFGDVSSRLIVLQKYTTSYITEKYASGEETRYADAVRVQEGFDVEEASPVIAGFLKAALAGTYGQSRDEGPAGGSSLGASAKGFFAIRFSQILPGEKEIVAVFSGELEKDPAKLTALIESITQGALEKARTLRVRSEAEFDRKISAVMEKVRESAAGKDVPEIIGWVFDEEGFAMLVRNNFAGVIPGSNLEELISDVRLVVALGAVRKPGQVQGEIVPLSAEAQSLLSLDDATLDRVLKGALDEWLSDPAHDKTAEMGLAPGDFAGLNRELSAVLLDESVERAISEIAGPGVTEETIRVLREEAGRLVLAYAGDRQGEAQNLRERIGGPVAMVRYMDGMPLTEQRTALGAISGEKTVMVILPAEANVRLRSGSGLRGNGVRMDLPVIAAAKLDLATLVRLLKKVLASSLRNQLKDTDPANFPLIDTEVFNGISNLLNALAQTQAAQEAIKQAA